MTIYRVVVQPADSDQEEVYYFSDGCRSDKYRAFACFHEHVYLVEDGEFLSVKVESCDGIGEPWKTQEKVSRTYVHEAWVTLHEKKLAVSRSVSK